MNYRDVRKRGRMIARVTRKRVMPPWLPVDGLVPLADSRRLSEEEIGTIRAWVAGGMPEGDPELLPEMPEFVEGWQLGEPDLVVTMPQPLRGAARRTRRLPQLRGAARPRRGQVGDRDRSPAGAGSGAPPRGHGVGTRPAGRARWRARTACPARCRPTSAPPAPSVVGRWARRRATCRWGLAYKLKAGDDLVLFSHLCPSGKPEIEQTTIGLHFTDTRPPRGIFFLPLPPQFGIATGLSVPPGEKNYEVRGHLRVAVRLDLSAGRGPRPSDLSRDEGFRDAPWRRAPADLRDRRLGLQLAGQLPVRGSRCACPRAPRSKSC